MTHHDLPLTILTAEDDPEYCMLVEEAFLESGQQNNLIFVQDGISLMQYLRRQGNYTEPDKTPRPDLILLDLNMPHMDGRESLAEIKADPNLRSIPVVVLTNSSDEEDVFKTYQLGSAGFITKPGSFPDLLNMVNGLNRYWFRTVQLIDCGQM